MEGTNAVPRFETLRRLSSSSSSSSSDTLPSHQQRQRQQEHQQDNGDKGSGRWTEDWTAAVEAIWKWMGIFSSPRRLSSTHSIEYRSASYGAAVPAISEDGSRVMPVTPPTVVPGLFALMQPLAHYTWNALTGSSSSSSVHTGPHTEEEQTASLDEYSSGGNAKKKNKKKHNIHSSEDNTERGPEDTTTGGGGGGGGETAYHSVRGREHGRGGGEVGPEPEGGAMDILAAARAGTLPWPLSRPPKGSGRRGNASVACSSRVAGGGGGGGLFGGGEKTRGFDYRCL